MHPLVLNDLILPQVSGHTNLKISRLQVYHLQIPRQLPPFTDLVTTHGHHVIPSMTLNKVVQLTVIHDWSNLVFRWLNHGQQRNDTIHRTIPPSQPTLRDPTLKFSAVALTNLRSPCTLVLRDTSLQLLGRLLSPLPTNCPVTVSEVRNKIGVLNAQRHHAVSNTPLSCPHSRKGRTITGADILCTECPTALVRQGIPPPNLVLRARPPSHRNATHVVNHISTKETVDAKVAQLTHHYSSDSETMSL